MSGVFTQAKRSEVMSRIQGRGNKETELALAKRLRAHGIKEWRRHMEIRSSKSEVRTFRVKPERCVPRIQSALTPPPPAA
jgi:G:T-mismatch repair DNA endonuclease (very short patch repair protein)